MNEPNPTHVLPVLASTAAELIDSALSKITEQAVADMLAKIAKLTAERDDARAKLAECREALDTIARVTGTSTEANKLARETLESTKP